MPDRGRDRQLERGLVERTPGGRAADPAGATDRGVAGDRSRPRGRAAGEQAHDLRGHPRLQLDVLARPPLRLALAPAGPRLPVRQALQLGASSACSSTRIPCRSNRLRLRLKRTTTADKRLPALARRVSAASPLGRNTRCSMSAQAMHTGPSSSMISHPPCSSPHSEQVKSSQRRDDHQVRRAALALSQPRLLSLRQLRRDPMRAIGPLDRGVARLGEPQRPAVARARNVSALARPQSARLRPTAKRAHRRRDLPQVRDRHPLQIVDPALAPLIDPARLQPADADQHIDRRHELALRERRLRRPRHPPLDVPAIAGHLARKLHTTTARGRLATQRTGRHSIGSWSARGARAAATAAARAASVERLEALLRLVL